MNRKRQPWDSVRALPSGRFQPRYATRWLIERTQLRPRTRELYEGLLRLHILPGLGDTELVKLTPTAIRTWHSELIHARQPRLAPRDRAGRRADAGAADGSLLIGPPKTDAGTRIVAIPKVLITDLEAHLGTFSGPGPDGLVFPGTKRQPLRRATLYTAWNARGTRHALNKRRSSSDSLLAPEFPSASRAEPSSAGVVPTAVLRITSPGSDVRHMAGR